MRKIEFRGMTEDGRWVFGNLCRTEQVDYIVVDGDFCLIEVFGRKYIRSVNFYKVLRETVGEFIDFVGIKDKKIFEGDIVQCEKNNPENPYDPFIDIAVIHWKNGCFHIGDIGYVDMIDNNFDEIKVIGNIHDNPELLCEENPLNGSEDERYCRCNNCGAKYNEDYIKNLIGSGKEFCPACGVSEWIADDDKEELKNE